MVFRCIILHKCSNGLNVACRPVPTPDHTEIEPALLEFFACKMDFSNAADIILNSIPNKYGTDSVHISASVIYDVVG